MIEVVALGELLIDFACTRQDAEGYPTMEAHPGGAPVNFLAALSKMGAKAAMLGKVGKDTFGQLLLGTMEKLNIETAGIITDDSVFTTLAFVTFDEKGDREFSFARKPGADTQLTFEELDLSLIDRAKVFHFGTLSLTDEPARTATQKVIAYAKAKGKLITCDPNLRKPLWSDMQVCREQLLWAISQADVLKISDDEVDFLFALNPEEGAKYILDNFGIKLVFVTCGPKGCYFSNGQASGFVEAPQGIRAIDTTGAGDIFGGTAVYQLLQQEKAPEALDEATLREITSFACTAASLSTTAPGGASSGPSMEEIQSFRG